MHCEKRLNLGSIGHGSVLVVADDGHVEERLEDSELRREQPIDGCQWDVGGLADRFDRCRSVATLEEQVVCRLYDSGSRQARSGLVRLDRRWWTACHDFETSAPEMIVILS